MPVIRLEVPVEGMEELYDFDDSIEDSESYPVDEFVITEEDGEEETGEEESFEEEHQEVLRSFRKKSIERKSGKGFRRSDRRLFCACDYHDHYICPERDLSLWRRKLFKNGYVSSVCPIFL